mgnify:CR=1 FL=1
MPWFVLCHVVTRMICIVSVYTPVDRFINESMDYFDLQRIGGLKSHLNKVHEKAVKESGIMDQTPAAVLSKWIY